MLFVFDVVVVAALSRALVLVLAGASAGACAGVDVVDVVAVCRQVQNFDDRLVEPFDCEACANSLQEECALF